MSQTLRLAVSQSRTLSNLSETLAALAATTRDAAARGVDLILFPEAYLGGYPRTCDFGATVGARTDAGREQFLQYFRAAVDLGDTPAGAGQAWVERRLDGSSGVEGTGPPRRGDGTREELERVARETGVFLVTGLVERSGGTLYCAVVYVCPQRGCVGKRRKVLPTGAERVVWGLGQAATLRAVTATIKGVRLVMAAAVCWENMMPLLRYALYSQDVNLWLAPTADARETWEPLMRTVAGEGRCFVLSANMCVRRKSLPRWITGEGGEGGGGGASASASASARTTSPPRQPNHHHPPSTSSPSQRRPSTVTIRTDPHELVLPSPPSTNTAAAAPPPNPSLSLTDDSNNENDDNPFVSRGGSLICGPMGQILAPPLWDVEDGGLLIRDCDFDDCVRGRLDLDVAGSYSRRDAFRLEVEGLDLSPPA